jgi:hypothetical protein
MASSYIIAGLMQLWEPTTSSMITARQTTLDRIWELEDFFINNNSDLLNRTRCYSSNWVFCLVNLIIPSNFLHLVLLFIHRITYPWCQKPLHWEGAQSQSHLLQHAKYVTVPRGSTSALPLINNAEEINLQWFPVLTTGGSLVLSGIQEK